MTDTTRTDDNAPLAPEQMLAIMERERMTIARTMAKQIPWILLSWGIAWLLGYGALWLIDGLKPAFSLPLVPAAITFVALLTVAVVISAVIGSRAGRGIRTTPAASFTGAVFGITCSVAFIAIYGLAFGLAANGMGAELQTIFIASGMALIVGLMYLVAGAIWHAVPSIVMGGLMVVVALIAPFFGYPNHYLFLSIAGGAVFIVGAIAVARFARGGAAA
jgi:hypothetical protein